MNSAVKSRMILPSALTSLAQKAVKEGIFKDEIVPVVKKSKKGEEDHR